MSQTMQTAQPLPDEFHLLAEAHGLGQLKDSWCYRAKISPFRQARITFFALGAIVWAIGITPIILYWVFAPGWGALLVTVLLILSPLSIAIFPYFYAIRHRADLLALYTNGFIQRDGKRVLVFSWATIEQIWRGQADTAKKSIADIDMLRLKQHDRSKFALNATCDVDFRATLCDAIERGF